MTTLKASIVNSIGKLLANICHENSISKISNNSTSIYISIMHTYMSSRFDQPVLNRKK